MPQLNSWQSVVHRRTDRTIPLPRGCCRQCPANGHIGIEIKLNITADRPEGRIALTNARIITMEGNEVIKKGAVLPNGNKIDKIGKRVRVPAGVQTIDCSGKTIMPGIVDVHGHLGDFHYGLSPQRNWC